MRIWNHPLILSTILVVSTVFANDPSIRLMEPDELAISLSTKETAVRRQALMTFAQTSPLAQKYQPILKNALKDQDRTVRQLAAIALVNTGLDDPSTIEELIRGITRRDFRYDHSSLDSPVGAKNALIQLGAKAVPSLIKAWEDRQDPIGYWILDTLASIGADAKSALPVLTKSLKDRKSPLFSHVVKTKWKIDGDTKFALKELVPLLDTQEGRKYGNAITVIANMGPSGKDAVPDMIRAMKKYNEPNLVWALGQLAPYAKEQALPALKEAFNDRVAPLEAAAALHNLRVPLNELVPELLKMFDRCEEEKIDPYGVAHQIAVCSSPIAIPGLIRALKHQNRSVKAAAAWALCRVGGDKKEIISVLTEALKDKDTAEEAARSLQMIHASK